MKNPSLRNRHRVDLQSQMAESQGGLIYGFVEAGERMERGCHVPDRCSHLHDHESLMDKDKFMSSWGISRGMISTGATP